MSSTDEDPCPRVARCAKALRAARLAKALLSDAEDRPMKAKDAVDWELDAAFESVEKCRMELECLLEDLGGDPENLS